MGVGGQFPDESNDKFKALELKMNKGCHQIKSTPLAPAAGVPEAAALGRQTSLPHGAAEVRRDAGPAAALPADAPTAAAATPLIP